MADSWMDGDAAMRSKVKWMRSITALAAVAGVTTSVAATRPAPARTASIHGVVGVHGVASVSGNAPAPKPIDMGGDDYCTMANAGGQVMSREVVTDGSGHLANVIVYIRDGAKVAKSKAPADPVVLDQRNCMYEPHVVALQVNQPLVIRNSDATLHNVHVHAKANKTFNVGQPIKGLETRRTFSTAETGIHVACDIHGWMSGAIAVFDHAFFDVTGDDGSFSIDALPAGEYVIEAWHETLGTQEQRVTVGTGEAVEVSFTFGG
jgi:plastocyanin